MKRAKTILERAQEMFGVTRGELLVATVILVLTSASLAFKWIANPDDPFDQQLNAQLSHLLDSVTAAQQNPRGLSSDSNSVSMNPDSNNSANTFSGHTTYRNKALPNRPVNINTATKQELMQLPGVGVKMAEKIMERRESRKFARPEDLLFVSGIGEKKFAKMKEYVVVE